MSDSSGTQWTVYRRYSDFGSFDTQIRKILPELRRALPAKEFVRPLIGLLGGMARDLSQPSPAFLDERRQGLDRYVKDILETAGGRRTSVWNHPMVLTFFDIPRVVQSRPRRVSSENSIPRLLACPIPLSEWEMQRKMAEKLLGEAKQTRDRAERIAERGHDVTNQMKHLKRQRTSIRISLEKLQKSLDYFAKGRAGGSPNSAVGIADDATVEGMSMAFQQLSAQVALVFPDLFAGGSSSGLGELLDDQQSCSHSSITSIIPTEKPPRSEPLAKTPTVRPSSFSLAASKGSAAKTPLTPPRPALGEQSDEATLQRSLAHQDERLSELSSIISRQKSLAEAIGAEVGIPLPLLGCTFARRGTKPNAGWTGGPSRCCSFQAEYCGSSSEEALGSARDRIAVMLYKQWTSCNMVWTRNSCSIV